MSWLTEGPLHQFRENHPGLARGAQVGGLPGAAVGALYDWGTSRGWWGSENGPISGQQTADTVQAGQNEATQGGINWDANIGLSAPEGYRGDYDMGPPSGTPQAQTGNSDAPAQADDGSAAPWYDDVSMGSSDELGLVPDYDNGATQRASHQEILDRLDAERNNHAGNYGISGMIANGGSVIMGSRGNDMNQVAMIRRTPGT